MNTDPPRVETGLAHREKWAGFDPLVGEAAELISAIRDRVVDAARMTSGQRVLDVDAGTGLVALEASQRVAPGGTVVAADISEGALRTCRERALDTSGASGAASVCPVAGEALRLPFAEGAFDAVTARSPAPWCGPSAATSMSTTPR